ncbi:MAG: tRNA (guanine(46)-N(7))-methyltransferase TrmB [Clostridia bacterium]|nr:tRNA (guanine(46)-N(7))-methyltransferase TrmB [Clostridia bacterium]
MRQRRLKDLDDRLDAYENQLHIDRTGVRGSWQKMFAKPQPLYMELGCGKGQFIFSHAKANPDRNFIAVEGNRSVMLRALEKAGRILGDPELKTGVRVQDTGLGRTEAVQEQAGTYESRSRNSIELGTTAQFDTVFSVLPNLILVNMYIRALSDVFLPDELSGLYLNFSDPWPKERHAKRRLTHAGYLQGYRKVLKPGSFLEFKTDNEDLFRFSVEQFKEVELPILEYSENLHGEEDEERIPSAKFMTEYEQKFSRMGKQIFYCKVQYPENR